MISSQKRITKANAVHSRSSRSHHVFQIRINSQDPKGKKPKKSLLNVVDLAGSERRNNFRDDVDNYLPGQRKKSHKSTKSLYSEYNDMKMSQQGTNILEDTASELQPSMFKSKMASTSKSKRQVSFKNEKNEVKEYDLDTEGKFINKNLTTLGRIFAILSNRKLQTKESPPYRECKLTRLLQNSLQYENCKTLMIVNVCQNKENAVQTKESLDFASKAMIAF